MPDLQKETSSYLNNRFDDRVIPEHAKMDLDGSIPDSAYRGAPEPFIKALQEQNEKLQKKLSNKVQINLAYVDGRIVMALKGSLLELKINKVVDCDCLDLHS